MEHLKHFVRQTWSGDLALQEVTPNFTSNELKEMEQHLEDHPELRDGLPEDFEPVEYQDMLLQMLINEWK